MWKRYLLWFAHEHIDFRYPEIHSLLKVFNICMKFVEEPCHEKSYWIVEMASDEALRQIASRSMSVKWCLELWGISKSPEMLHKNLQLSLDSNVDAWCSFGGESNYKDKSGSACPRKLMEPYFTKEKSFKITVETFCRHFSLPEKIKKIEAFDYLPMDGQIKLKNPDTELMLLEYYGIDSNNIPDKPYEVFLGRLVSEGQRQLMSKLSLKTRKFIGNTSMDVQLSLLMANQAQITNGDIVLDPFVGSGSLLVAAAEFGGYVWGTDIDFLMLHAKTRPSRVKQKTRETDESIRANMCQYDTQRQYLDVMVSDFSLPIWRDTMKFDAIITDPPYGIREPTEKIGIERENYSLTEAHLVNHFPAKVDYGLPAIYSDLLSFSAKHLNLGRRLVCWFPFYREDYKLENMPSHRCLRLVGNSEQVLSVYTARRLLTYEKISEPLPDDDLNCRNKCFDNKLKAESNGAVGEIADSKDSGVVLDFRQKYFDSGVNVRKERKEQRAREKERGKMEKALRRKPEQLSQTESGDDISENNTEK